MKGPAEYIVLGIWRLLPATTRTSLSSKILNVQKNMSVQLPISDVKVYSGSDELLTSASASPAYSLVFTCYNEEENIEKLLDSIYSQQWLPREIVAVDGGSTDRTVSRIKNWKEKKGAALSFDLRILQEGRLNIAAGRNLAASAAKEEILVFTDAGCEPDRFWSLHLLQPFSRDSSTNVAMGWYRPVCRSSFSRALLEFVTPSLEAVNPKTFLPSARSLAVKKEVFSLTAGFPEWLSLAGEDSLFDYYLKHSTKQLAFCPKAIVFWKPPLRPLTLLKMVKNYAQGDAEGGKISWNYYVSLSWTLIKSIIEIFLGFLMLSFSSLVPLIALSYILIFWGLGRFVLLLIGYRPFSERSEEPINFLVKIFALKCFIVSQFIGFLSGLLGRKDSERRRVSSRKGGVVYFTQHPLFVGDVCSANDFSRKIRTELDGGKFVTVIYSGFPKNYDVASADFSIFEHQFVEQYMRASFDLESWKKKYLPLFAKLDVVDQLEDAFSKAMRTQLVCVKNS